MVNGGTIVIDFSRPHVILGPYAIAGDGTAQAPLPVPAAVTGVTIALQWAYRHPDNGAVLVSRALRASL
jgi:hypothetical protein